MLKTFGDITFASVIDSLDKTIEHDQQNLLAFASGGGRAYLHKPGQYYGGEIFFGNRGEEHYGKVKGFETSEKYKGGIYMGGAGIINLSYIAAMCSDAGILFDVNPHQKIFWDVFLKLLAECEDKVEFAKLNKDAEETIRLRVLAAAENETLHQYFYGVSNPHTAGNHYRSSMSYLGAMPIVSPFVRKPPAELIWYDDDEHYNYVHQLAKAGKIGSLTLDVCDEISIASVVKVLGDTRLACLYVSNIFTFFENGSDWTDRNFSGRPIPTVQSAKTALGQLLCKDSLIISHNSVETNFWNEIVYNRFVMGSNGNAREIVPFP